LLVCEDNGADVLLVRQAVALYEVPGEIRVVANGDDALALIGHAGDAAGCCPSVVLLDLNLPGLSGADVLARIRAQGPCKDVPVVIFTSSDSAEDRRKMAELGATRYFRKPAGYEEFLKIGLVLKEVLQGA